jgi:hypothetical protein
MPFSLGYVSLHWDTFHCIGICDHALSHDRDAMSLLSSGVPREVVPLWLWVSNHKREIFDLLYLIPVLPEAGASKASFSKNPWKRSVREASIIYIYIYIYIYNFFIYIAFIFKKICR